MVGAKSRSEMEGLEHQLGDWQVQHVAMVGSGPRSQDWCNRAKKKIETREKPTSSSAQCSLQLAESRQELNSRSVLLGNKLRMGWTPSETALHFRNSLQKQPSETAGTAGKGAYSCKKPSLSLQTYQAVGSRAGRMMLRGEEGKSAAKATAEKGSFFPGVTYSKDREQACSWPKTREHRDSEKIGDKDMPKRNQGGRVSQQVAAIQQGKAQLKRGPASASSPLVLEPVKSLPRGSLVHHTTCQNIKPTNSMKLGGTEGCTLSAAELPVKEKEVCGSRSTANEEGTMPAMRADKPELTIATPANAGDKHHHGERMNSPQPTCVPGEPETRNTTSTELKCGAEGVDPTANEAEAAHCLSGVSRTPYGSSGSLEPGGLSVSPEVADMVNEKSKANTDESPGEHVPVSLGGIMEPSSISPLPGIKSKGAEFEKTIELKPVSILGFLEQPGPEHASQENKAEKSRVSSPGVSDKTDDHSVSCLQETEPQGTCGPLTTHLHEDSLRHDIKSPGTDVPLSADTPLKGNSVTWPLRDEVNNSKSNNPGEVPRGNFFHSSEQLAKLLDSPKPSVSLDKSRGHTAGEEKNNLTLSGESSVHMPRPGAQGKDTRSSQACREMLDKAFGLGKNAFTTFGSEDKGSTPKKETTTQRKSTKPQSALVTLFGYSSEKKQSQREKPVRSSEQTNIDDMPEKPQGLLNSSSQARQNSSKNDQLPQPGKMKVFPKRTQESSGSFSNRAEGKEVDVLLLGPGTSISCGDRSERTEINIHDQLVLTSQQLVLTSWQQQNSCWPSLMPAQENQKEAAVTLEGGTNPLRSPPDLRPAADSSKNLIREGNDRGAHPQEFQNLLSLDVQGTEIEDGIVFSPGNSDRLPKEGEPWLDSADVLEDNNLFFSGGPDFPSVSSETPNSDLQNSEAEAPPCFDPNPSQLCQEIPAETNAPLVLWNTPSLSLLAEQDEINIRDPEGIQSCAMLQHLDPQRRAPKAAEDAFELGLHAEGSTNKHHSMQEDNFPLVYTFTSHDSKAFSQSVFGPFDVDSTKMDQEAPGKLNMSRKASGVEEYCESLSSADLNESNDGLSDQEFFI